MGRQFWLKDIVLEDLVQSGLSLNGFSLGFLEKIVLTTTWGSSKNFIPFWAALSLIGKQRANLTFAKKSIGAFKLRKGTPVGCRIDLRNRNMFLFLEELIHFVLPRVQGDKNLFTFDFNNNLHLGLSSLAFFSIWDDFIVHFPEYSFVGKTGVNVVFVFKSKNRNILLKKEEAFYFFRSLQFPLRIK